MLQPTPSLTHPSSTHPDPAILPSSSGSINRPPIRSTDDLLLALSGYPEIARNIMEYWETSCSFECHLEQEYKRIRVIVNTAMFKAGGLAEGKEQGVLLPESEKSDIQNILTKAISAAEDLRSGHVLLRLLKFLARVFTFLHCDRGISPKQASDITSDTHDVLVKMLRHHPDIHASRALASPFTACTPHDNFAQACGELEYPNWRYGYAHEVLEILGVHEIGNVIGIGESSRHGMGSALWSLPWETETADLMNDEKWNSSDPHVDEQCPTRITLGHLGSRHFDIASGRF